MNRRNRAKKKRALTAWREATKGRYRGGPNIVIDNPNSARKKGLHFPGGYASGTARIIMRAGKWLSLQSPPCESPVTPGVPVRTVEAPTGLQQSGRNESPELNRHSPRKNKPVNDGERADLANL